MNNIVRKYRKQKLINYQIMKIGNEIQKHVIKYKILIRKKVVRITTNQEDGKTK